MQDLFEAPISQLDVHHMDQPGSFADGDRKLLRSPQHISKIKQRFAQTEVDFALFFVNQPGKSYSEVPPAGSAEDASFTQAWTDDMAHAGLTTPAAVAAAFNVHLTPDPAAINVVYVSNTNIENSVSLTPWIIAHRFGHALTDNDPGLPGEIKRLMDWLPRYDRVIAAFGEHQLRLKQTMTTRSARTAALGNAECREELIAQYLMQGQTRLKLPQDWLAQAKPDQTAETSLQMQLIRKARQIDELLKDVLDQCVGRLFVAL